MFNKLWNVFISHKSFWFFWAVAVLVSIILFPHAAVISWVMATWIPVLVINVVYIVDIIRMNRGYQSFVK
jgi:hypothetical protein